MNRKHVSLGETIQQMRERAGLTQDELSDRAGLSYSTLAKIERGAVKNPSVFTVASLANALGCSIEELLRVEQPAAVSSTPADTFLFSDMNGVLVRFYQRAFSRIAEENDLSVDKVETVFWHYNDAANRGEMSLDTFNTVMAENLGVPKFDFHEIYLECIEPITEMHDLLRVAVKKYGVGILSNTHEKLVDRMLKKGLIPDIDYTCIVDSSQVKAIKPEPKIYEIAEELSGARGEQILFVDDSRTNLIAAQRYGWRVMWFDDYRPADSVMRLKQALEL